MAVEASLSNHYIHSASSVIQTSIIQILDYPNKPDGRLRHCKTCLRMRNLTTVMGVANFRSLRDCKPIAPVSFIKDMTKLKRKKKAIGIKLAL